MPFNSLTHRRVQRALAVSLAAASVMAPAASARPADVHAAAAQAAANAAQTQDLRTPDARDAGTVARQPRSAGHPGRPVNAPGATAVDPATRPALPGPPPWPANPVPINQVPALAVTDDTDGVNWTTIGLGIAGGLLAIGGLALLSSRRSRRTQRLRVTV